MRLMEGLGKPTTSNWAMKTKLGGMAFRVLSLLAGLKKHAAPGGLNRPGGGQLYPVAKLVSELERMQQLGVAVDAAKADVRAAILKRDETRADDKQLIKNLRRGSKRSKKAQSLAQLETPGPQVVVLDADGKPIGP